MANTVSAEDRVLLVSLSDRSGVRMWSRARMLVGVGTEDEVLAARREFADLDNVMFVVGDRASIPWQDRFFTLIVDPGGEAPSADMLRCLAENGRVVGS